MSSQGERAVSVGMDRIDFQLAPIVSTASAGALWRNLELTSAGSFFVSWTWIRSWLECLPRSVQPLLLTASRNGLVMGAAILVSRNEWRRGVLKVRQWHFNSTGERSLDAIWIEHNDFIGREDVRQELWPAFLRWFAEQKKFDELIIPRVSAQAIAAIPPQIRLLLRSESTPGYLLRPLNDSEATLPARLSRNTRQQLRRSLRDCERLGPVAIETAPSIPTALAWFDAMKALHITYWTARGLPHAFQYPFAEKFLRHLIEVGVPQQRVQLSRITAGAVVLGYLCNFRRNKCIYAYQSGFDYSRAELRPGYVSHFLAIEQAGREGMTAYDFLCGENRLKSSFASEKYRLVTHRLGRPTAALRLEAAAIVGVASRRRRTAIAEEGDG